MFNVESLSCLYQFQGAIPMENPKRDDACSTYVVGKARKAHKVQSDLKDGLRASQERTNALILLGCGVPRVHPFLLP